MLLKELRGCIKITEEDDKWLEVPEKKDNCLLITDLMFEMYGCRSVKDIRIYNEELLIELHKEEIALKDYDYKVISVPVSIFDLHDRQTYEINDCVVEKFSERIIRDLKLSIDYNTGEFCVKIILKEEC